jgi:hypothetical protein
MNTQLENYFALGIMSSIKANGRINNHSVAENDWSISDRRRYIDSCTKCKIYFNKAADLGLMMKGRRVNDYHGVSIQTLERAWLLFLLLECVVVQICHFHPFLSISLVAIITRPKRLASNQRICKLCRCS